MKEIQVTNKYKILVIPHNYQLCEYIQGGKQVRDVKTGEMVEQKAGWKKLDVYYANLNAMVARIAKLESDENATNLTEWLDKYTNVVTNYFGDK